ncbi:Protein SON [Merluccius polli]|uniref:Protein SON n=1 Tax=Merluccius polli TaxID=89951 RepID=A0AA47ME73_MERPO|nr:Protein SON [Merluccius polli]
MAANIEQIFQDFILNKIREIEDQQEDNGPVKALAPDAAAATAARTGADSEREDKEEDGQGAVLKKHKKHKKHKSKKSKKKKRKRDKDEKESSSESGGESDAEAKRRSSKNDGNRKAGRHKQHLTGKKKKKKRRKEDGRSSSDSDSDGSRVPGSSVRRQEDLPDIIPKQDSSKTGGADAGRDGARTRSRSARRAHRSRSRSRSRSARRARCSRSARRTHRSRSRSRSRPRRRRSRSRSCSRSRRRRTRSTSRSSDPRLPEAVGTAPAVCAPDPPVLLPHLESPSPPGAVAAKSAGSWKPLPPLEVATSARYGRRPRGLLSRPRRSRGGRPRRSRGGRPRRSRGGPAGRRAQAPEWRPRGGRTDPGQMGGHGGGLCYDLGPLPGPCEVKTTSTVPAGSVDSGHTAENPRLSEKPNPAAASADGNESESRSSTKKKKRTSKSPQKKKEGKSSSKKGSRRRSRSHSQSHRRSSRSGSRARRKRSGSRRKRSGSRGKRSGSRGKRSVSRGKRSGSRRKRSGSRGKRSRSRRRRSGSRGKRSGSRGKRSVSRGKRSGSRPRRRSRSRKRSKSRSPARRSRRSRSRSGSRAPRRSAYSGGGGFSQRDRWKREPSRSPVLILRKNRSPAPKHGGDAKSPPRITELDKEQLLEIAKANAAAMCTKAGVPVPDSLKPRLTTQLPLPLPLPNMAMNAAVASMTAATMTAALSSMGALASLPPLPSISNKPPPGLPQPNMAVLEEVKKKVTKQANSISIKEFTDKCKMIVDSKGELPVAKPHVSDEEDEGKPFGSAALREQKAISFSINNMSVRPAVRSDAGIAKEFPVSSGSQHRKKEGEAPGAYGEWVPVEKMSDKAAKAAAAAVIKAAASATSAPAVSSPGETVATTQPPAATLPAAPQPAAPTPASDSVFPEPPLQPVDISQAVTERITAQRRLAENPYDVSAICMLSRAQEQVDAWAQSNSIPGLFTGSTGAQVLSSEELSSSGPQAWLKKDQFLRAAPVSGGVGEFLMRKMGWKTGEGLGRNREGTVEPIVIDFKIDRKGLVAEGEKPQKQTGGLVVTKDLMGKHPVSALIELCNKKRIMQPDFVMVHHSGPDHRKNFLFKVTVNSVDYQPQTASPNKKHAKAMAAMVALQGLGEVPADGPGLYTGPVFTAASTGPLFST